MLAPPDGFILVPGPARVTATAAVFGVALDGRASAGAAGATGRSPASHGPLVCKRLGSRAAAEPWVRARLSAEGELLKRLGGAATPRLVAAGEDGHGPFIVMDRVAGAPLSARLGGAASGWITKATRATFAALDRLHEAGVVHADLSPDNVFCSPDAGVATLLDLGLAVYAGAPPMPVGPFRGTPAYAAPELVRGEPFDARADLFALAATLLHVASGSRPRPAQSEAAVLLSAGENDVTPWARAAARGLDAATARALLACCAFEARCRPPSAHAVTVSLDL